jgi:integrase
LPINGLAREVLIGLPRSGDLLFPGDKDGQHVQNIYAALRRIRTRAGLPATIRPLHALRHVFASRLANSDTPLYTIQKLLRHADGRMTQRYSHLTDKALFEASEKAGAIMELAQGNVGKVINLRRGK